MSNFKFRSVVNLILEHEGGYVNHPKDPGGCTNFGITIKTYRTYVDKAGTCVGLRHMKKQVAEGIYERTYWWEVRGPDLPAGIDLCVFDMGVNAGPKRAIVLLQRAMGLIDDGIIGPKTMSKVWVVPADKLIDDFTEQRNLYYKRLRGFKTFGRGWMTRSEVTREAAHKRVTEYKIAEGE